MLRVVDLGDLWDSLKSHMAQDQRLKLVLEVTCDCLLRVVLDAIDSKSDDMLITIFISHHDVDLVSEDFRQFLVNKTHLKTFVNHLIAI